MTTNDNDCRPEFEAWLAACGKSPLMWNTSDAMLAAWGAATRAQREAVVRVEAERDEALEFMRINARSGMSYAEQRDAAQAQLAELQRAYVTMTNQSMLVDGEHCYYLKSSEMAAFDRIFTGAQAEQQEAQGAQAGDEHRGKYWAFRNEDGELCITDRWDVAKHIPFDVITLVERAALATQPGEWVDPVALHPAENLYNQGFADGVSEAKRLNAVRGAEHDQ